MTVFGLKTVPSRFIYNLQLIISCAGLSNPTTCWGHLLVHLLGNITCPVTMYTSCHFAFVKQLEMAVSALQMHHHHSILIMQGRLAGLITCFKVQEAGRYAASGDCQGVLKLWSLASGVQLDVRDDAHPAGCSSVAFLEPHVVSCSQSLAFHAHVAPQ